MAIAALMGVGTAVKGEEAPSLDLNFDGQASSGTGDDHWDSVTLLLDGSSATDLSPASPTITPSSSAPTTGNSGGKHGQYIDFDGSNNYYNVALPSALGVNGEAFTVECWAWLDTTANDGVFQLLHSGKTLDGNIDDTSNSIAVAAASGQWQFYTDGGPGGGYTGSNSTNTWYHIALVYDGTDLVLYIDGAAIATGSNWSSYPTGGYPNIAIGGYYTTGYVLDGRIEDFRVTKGVARYTSNFTPPSTKLPTAKEATALNQLATSIVTQNKSGSVQSKYLGPNGKLINGYVDNKLPYSSIGSWTLQSNMTATASSVTDPFGGTGAFQIADNDGSLWRYAEVTGLSVSSGTQATLSLYVHASANSTTQIGFNIKNSGGTDQYPRMGFTNNVPTSLGNGGSYYQVAGTDWYRWEFPFTTGATSIEFYPAVANASDTGYVTVFGAQLETGSGTASQLVQTSGASVAAQVPRVEFDASGNPLGLLVEEARTNLWPNGQSDFGGATANGGSTASTTAVTAPDGTTSNIYAITESGSAASHHVYTQLSGISATTTYTASFYLKKGSEDYGFVYFEGGNWAQALERVWFDLANGTVGTETGSSVGHIVDAGNGWYRCSVTTTLPSSFSSAYVSIGFSSANGGVNSSGASAVTGYYWGMQVEQGEGPTSLIYDNTASSATRPADNISLATSSFGYNTAAATAAIDATVASKANANYPRLFELNNGTGTYRSLLSYVDTALSELALQWRESTVTTQTITTGVTYPLSIKVAQRRDGSTGGHALNGSLGSDIAITTAATSPTVLSLGTFSNASQVMNGHIRRFTYWPRAINDAQLSKFTNQ